MIPFLVNSTPPTILTSPPSLPSGPHQLLLCKFASPITHLKSTLLQVFILRNLKPFGINTYEKQGEGVVITVNHLLETSHPLQLSKREEMGTGARGAPVPEVGHYVKIKRAQSRRPGSRANQGRVNFP